MNETIDYYERNAAEFANNTADLEFSEIQDMFLKKLKGGAVILDFGCGAGRDTRYFLSKGFQVDATDGSEELCKIAEKNP